MKIGGAKLDLNRTYTVAGCERDGKPMDVVCRLKEVQDAAYLPGSIHTVLKSYLKADSPIGPTREGWVRATDLPPVVWSQYGTLQRLCKILK